jgi:hypothetical protein
MDICTFEEGRKAKLIHGILTDRANLEQFWMQWPSREFGTQVPHQLTYILAEFYDDQ